MKNIGIIPNLDKDVELKYTRLLVESIKKEGGNALVSEEISGRLGLECGRVSDSEVYDNSDALICLGGDGTFLKAARKAYTRNLPVLGINLGSLGFLTEIDRNDIPQAAKRVIHNDFEIEERMMLEASVINGGEVVKKDIALNDVVVTRGALSRILNVKTYINDVFVDSFPSDGVIVSSPTGSTAYSLSAGGPIVDPDCDLIIISPICPHILYSRSVITTGNGVVRVEVDKKYCHDAMVTVDGQEGIEITGGQWVEVRKASNCVKMMRINTRNFFNILRTKIYDRGERLRKDEV